MGGLQHRSTCQHRSLDEHQLSPLVRLVVVLIMITGEGRWVIKMMIIGGVMVRRRPRIRDLWAGGNRIYVFRPVAQWSWIICNEVRQLLVRGLSKELWLDLHDLMSARCIGGCQPRDSHRLFAIDRCELLLLLLLL